MIFKIADGRECFYQWDIDRQLIVSDPTITEVHFCNRTDVCSLVVEVVDGVANVPNKLLQNGYAIRVFGYDGKATMHEATFEVKARTQPTDYVYTEVEIKRYSDLEKRIDEMEAATDEKIGEVVNNYLEEHPIQPVTKVSELENDADYVNKTYVDEAVQNVQVDLTGYATEDYVDEAVKNVEVDLSDYAKKTDIPDVSDFISEIPEEYITETELNNKGYLTEHQSLEGYATEKYVDDAIAAIEIPEDTDRVGAPLYQHTVYLTSNATSTSESYKAPSFYATFICGRAEAFTFASFADYLYSTGSKLAVSGTLRYSGYYSASPAPLDNVYAVSKTELRLVHRKTSENADEIAEISVNSSNLSSFADTIVLIGSASVVEGGEVNVDLSNYYTKEETYSKTEVDGLIPEPTDLAGYATETYVDTAIQDALSGIAQAEGGAY